MPNFPDNKSLSRDDAINKILYSIALEELALSHVINAEGEKIQYILGTLDGNPPPEPATVGEVIQVNQSVEKTLEVAVKKQAILTEKMTNALKASNVPGPPGPPGPPGLIEVRPITEANYLALSDEEKRSPGILWAIYPDT